MLALFSHGWLGAMLAASVQKHERILRTAHSLTQETIKIQGRLSVECIDITIKLKTF